VLSETFLDQPINLTYRDRSSLFYFSHKFASITRYKTSLLHDHRASKRASFSLNHSVESLWSTAPLRQSIYFTSDTRQTLSHEECD